MPNPLFLLSKTNKEHHVLMYIFFITKAPFLRKNKKGKERHLQIYTLVPVSISSPYTVFEVWGKQEGGPPSQVSKCVKVISQAIKLLNKICSILLPWKIMPSWKACPKIKESLESR